MEFNTIKLNIFRRRKNEKEKFIDGYQVTIEREKGHKKIIPRVQVKQFLMLIKFNIMTSFSFVVLVMQQT